MWKCWETCSLLGVLMCDPPNFMTFSIILPFSCGKFKLLCTKCIGPYTNTIFVHSWFSCKFVITLQIFFIYFYNNQAVNIFFIKEKMSNPFHYILIFLCDFQLKHLSILNIFIFVDTHGVLFTGHIQLNLPMRSPLLSSHMY